jgi:hypothetical protein
LHEAVFDPLGRQLLLLKSSFTSSVITMNAARTSRMRCFFPDVPHREPSL